MTPPGFDTWSRIALSTVEEALGRWVPGDAPGGLGEAMRYRR
jgi:farnesyl diphosphate synthase